MTGDVVNSITFSLLVLLCFVYIPSTLSQYAAGTTQYEVAMKANKESLDGEIQSHPDVNLQFFPERALLANDYYKEDFPVSANYRIGLLMDPCRFNAYNCCMNVFGSPEYPALLKSNLEQERAYKYLVLAEDDEVSKNYFLVNEDGASLSSSATRSPDDYEVYNETCVSLNNPNTFCQGRNYALQRSPIRPPCMDNNKSINSLAGCYTPEGVFQEKCVQVAYSSNAFIPQCGVNENEHCGTYLEVHMAHGTPYQDETTVIASTQLTTRNVSGYYTTVLPLTWMKNQSKVLCAYSESFLRVGSLVYIKDTAPVCCCATPFTSVTRVGSFQCPVGPTANGAFGYHPRTMADTLALDILLLDYPFCPIDLSYNEDRIMCSAYDARDRRAYVRNCTKVEIMDRSRARPYGSTDMGGLYDGVCQYYDSCASTTDGICLLNDLKFTFIGRVGVVTAVDNAATIPQVWVSFNYGRTSYQFKQSDVKLETRSKSMYELWWVVRSKSWLTVQKKKSFNVTYPGCTFDITNNRYFPYAILQTGKPLDNSLYP